MPTAAPMPGCPRYFHGNSTLRHMSSMTTYGSARVFVMVLSSDGSLLATGDEDGVLEVRMFRSSTWRRVCLYTTGSAIRAIVWHPLQPTTLFCGSANGTLHKITIIVGGNNILRDATVPGYIHLLQLSRDGQRLLIAHGRMISIIDNPFPQHQYLGTLINLSIPMIDSMHVRTLADCYIPRGIFFLPHDTSIVLVAFLGRRGLRAYSLLDQSFVWSIPLREDAILGSAAISPSGERVAVMNLQDGIDFYSTSRRQYLSTTRYTLSSQHPPQNLIVDILFVDDETVAFGHADGQIGFATFGVDRVDTFFDIGGHEPVPVQVVTFGLVSNSPLVFGLASPRESPQTQTPIRYPSDIHIGRIETPGFVRDSPAPSAMLHTSVYDVGDREGKLSRARVAAAITIAILSVFLAQAILGGSSPTDPAVASATPRISPIDPPAPSFTITTPDPISTCICTVTGSIEAANSRESGGS